MSNMSYCRFRNVLIELQDCQQHFEDTDLGDEEIEARIQIYDICKDIVDNFEREDLEG